jgi:hypothetical protein
MAHTITTQALEETFRAYSAAMQRTGTTPETRMLWLLTVLYTDVHTLSRGDLLNLSDELAVYASPLKSGYYVVDIKEGKTTEAIRNASIFSPRTITRFQARLLHDLQDVLAGTVVKTEPRIAYVGCATPQQEFQLTRTGDLLARLRLGLWLDLEQLGLARLRTCERGTLPGDRALHIVPCGKLFFATDLRQRYCGPACGKDVRWRRYWHDKGDAIKRKRRKEAPDGS